MTNSLISPITIFKDIYHKHNESLSDGLLKQLSEECWEKFQSIGLPNTKWENWQYADLTPMFDNFFNAPTIILKKSNLNSQRNKFYPNNLLIENGTLKHATVSNEIKINTISKLNEIEINTLVKKVSKKISTEPNPFVLLNYALFSSGVLIKIGDNSNVKIHISSECDSSIFVSPFIAIECGNNSEVEIIYQETRDQKAIAGVNSLLLLEAGENSHINLNHLQLDGSNGYHLSHLRGELKRNAVVEVQGVFAGSELSRLDTSMALIAEGAEINYRILNILKGICQQHHLVCINHLEPHGTSTQLFKNILYDKSKVSVDGTVEVAHGAKKTNSQQLINNLFLSDGARAFTKPNLRILNDDVKCKHGATSGSLEKENLFYLKSRGLSDEASRNLITKSFANEVLSQIKNPELLEFISSSIFD